jgi:hypothetical protein
MQVDFPFAIDRRGRTSQAAEEKHIRDLIEQILFTSPGERVNRPDFGSGLMQLVFAPNSDALAAAIQLSIQASLQQWLSDRIIVDSLSSETQDSAFKIELRYVIRSSQKQIQTTISRPL